MRTDRVRIGLLVLGLTAAGGAPALAGCGATMKRTQALPELRSAIRTPVDSRTQNEENSRLVERIADGRVLDGMRRHEVAEALGKGDPCSRHPRCREEGFDPDDWFYTVGRMGRSDTGRQPILIVGFDRTGQVDRVWNLRIH